MGDVIALVLALSLFALIFMGGLWLVLTLFLNYFWFSFLIVVVGIAVATVVEHWDVL